MGRTAASGNESAAVSTGRERWRVRQWQVSGPSRADIFTRLDMRRLRFRILASRFKARHSAHLS